MFRTDMRAIAATRETYLFQSSHYNGMETTPSFRAIEYRARHI